MTDVAPAPDNAEAELQPGGPQIRILAQFTRDLSFENPRAPESLRAAQAQPQIELGVEMSARGRPDQLFEVDLKLSATARHEGETSFVVELVYGGAFPVDRRA
jgi:preprotein translocase subunit SecB